MYICTGFFKIRKLKKVYASDALFDLEEETIQAQQHVASTKRAVARGRASLEEVASAQSNLADTRLVLIWRDCIPPSLLSPVALCADCEAVQIVKLAGQLMASLEVVDVLDKTRMP